MISDVQDVVAMALGAEPITTTVEGRERYTVAIRYPRDLRSDPQAIAKDVLVSLPNGGTVPFGEVADIKLTQGRDQHPHRERQARHVRLRRHPRSRSRRLRCRCEKGREREVQLPTGTYLVWSGQFEYLERAEARLQMVVPVTLMIIFLLLYLNFRRLTETLIVMLSLPFALVGGFWLMWWLGFNLSVAVAVGFIALAGVAAETGVVMLIYLDHAVEEVTGQVRSRAHDLTRRQTCTMPS